MTGRSSPGVPPEVIVTVWPASAAADPPAEVGDPPVPVDASPLASAAVFDGLPDVVLTPLDVVPRSAAPEVPVPESVEPALLTVEESPPVSADAIAPLMLTRTSPAQRRHAPAVRWIRVTIGVSSQ